MKGRPIQIGSRLTRPDTNRFKTAGTWWTAPRDGFTKLAVGEHLTRMQGAGWSRMVVESQGDASRRRHTSKSAYPEGDL